MNAPTLKLPRGADELLRDLPMNEPDFEAQALAIEARLQAKLGAAPLDDVLGAPALTPEAEEPAAGAAAQSTPLPKSSFAEMARKSLQRKDEDDNGAALAKELLAATSQARRPDAEMVARVRAAGKAPSTATPLPHGERPSGVVSRIEAPAVPVAATASDPGTKRGVVIGLFAAALAVAAAFALFVRSGTTEPAPPPSAALEPHTATAAATPDRDAVDVASPTPAAPHPAADGVIDPEALAVAANDSKPTEAKAGVAKSPAGGAAAPPPKSASAAGGAAKPSPDAEAHAPAPSDAPRSAEPQPEPLMKPAEGSADNMPLSPSSGAVSTALGAVRSNAQACLAGQTESVKAVVIFSSDGRVSSVSAAGPSGACIQAALSKAHLGPFAKDHFSATTTIRPP